MIRLLVADDHQALVDGFISIINEVDDIAVVATAANGYEVLKKLEEVTVDIVLMDINMPELNGVETCKRIRTKYVDIKVIALTMHKKQSFIKRMMQYGAKGYLLKDDPSSEIIRAVRAVMEGNIYHSQRVRDIALAFSDMADQSTELSPRELEILQHISHGLTNQGIAEKLFLSPHTTETHRRNLLLKLDAKNTAELVRKGMEKGLI